MKTPLEQIAQDIRDRELSGRVRSFIDIARCVMLAKEANADVIAQRAGLPRQVRGILSTRVYQRAAVVAGSTSDATWAQPLADYQRVADAFLESLRHYGCFDAMLPAMKIVPLRTRVGASVTGISATGVGQMTVKPISKLTLGGGTVDDQKAVAVVAISEELARFSAPAAGDLFATELSAAVAVETDRLFVALLIANASTLGSSGVTAEHVRNDLRAALTLITTNARSNLFLLMTSTIAKILSVMHTSTGAAAFPDMTFAGGMIAGIRAVVSDGVPSGTMVLVDAQQIAAGSDSIRLDMATHAAIQMDTTPDSPPSASTVLLSLWQYDMVGLKAERTFGAMKLTTAGVVVTTGVAYTGDSPGP
jgi:HK97 family phage major capsid protein